MIVSSFTPNNPIALGVTVILDIDIALGETIGASFILDIGIALSVTVASSFLTGIRISLGVTSVEFGKSAFDAVDNGVNVTSSVGSDVVCADADSMSTDANAA